MCSFHNGGGVHCSVYSDIAVSSLSVKAEEGEKVDKETHLKYVINDEGTITITGYDIENEVIPSNYTMVIPSEIDGIKVTKIGGGAFNTNEYDDNKNSSRIISVEIPSSVEVIESEAFANCDNLKTLKLADGLESIGARAFSGSKIVSVDIPYTLVSDRNGSYDCCKEAFMECDELKTVTIPEGMIMIPNGLFKGCSGLEKIEIPATVSVIGVEAFNDCITLNQVTISEGVTEIRDGAFKHTALTEVDVPKSVEVIGSEAFADCWALNEAGEEEATLKTVILHDGLQAIGTEAFRGSEITSVDIPYTLVDERNGIYACCKEAFAGCDDLTAVTIPEGMIKIPDDLFKNCRGLQKVEISASVVEIGGSAFQGTALTEVDVPKNVEAIGSEAFADCWALNEAGEEEATLKTVTLHNGLQTIGAEAFRGSKIITVDIPYTLVDERNGCYDCCKEAFAGCDELGEVHFSDRMYYIPVGLFKDCGGLREIEIPEQIDSIGKEAFGNCANLEKITILDPYCRIGVSGILQAEGCFHVDAGDASLSTISNDWETLQNDVDYEHDDHKHKKILIESPVITNNRYVTEWNNLVQNFADNFGGEDEERKYDFESLGEFEEPVPYKGDINKDGDIDILDVISLNRSILGKDTFTWQEADRADVNNSGIPDAADSLMILKRIVGLLNENYE